MTALLMTEGGIGMVESCFVLAGGKYVGHLEALPFLLWCGYACLSTCPARCVVRWQWPSLVPPGMPGGQKEAGYAPGVFDCLVLGEMPFDEGASGWRHVELRLEALGKEW